MTMVAYPLDAVAGSPQYTALMARQALSALAGPAPAGRPLGAFSGVRPGTPKSTVTATSTVWTIAPHSGWLDCETAATAAPYYYAVQVAETGTMTAASSSNPRVDLLTVRVNDPSQDSFTVPAAVIYYYTGTPAPTPSAPVVPGGEMALAQINVPKLGTGSPSVTWVAPTAGKVWWQARQTGTPTGVSNNAYTTVVFDTLDYAYYGSPSIGGGSFRAPVDGMYWVSADVTFASNSAGSRGGQIAVNGAGLDGSFVLLPASAGVARVPIPAMLVSLSTGDVVSLGAYQNSGAALNTGTAPGSRLTVMLA